MSFVLKAIRAMRHPERYGPRRADPTMGEFGQARSRARGLAHAILDTFPVVKYSRPQMDPAPTGQPKPSDTESAESREGAMEMGAIAPTVEEATSRSPVNVNTTSAAIVPRASGEMSSPGAGPSRSSSEIMDVPAATPRPQGTTNASAAVAQVMPDQIGRETCPICIVDFEEGDDLRVLPCEGKHVFHQQCVDQWLLELSSSCPICRQG